MQDCKVCQHPLQKIINQAIESGATLATLAVQFDLSEDALSRHRATHVGKISPQAQGVDPQELLASLLAAKQSAESIASNPLTDDKIRLEALREIRQSSEAIAKLTGAFKSVDPRHLLPFWHRIKSTLLKALESYPEAREAVLLALEADMGTDGK